VRVTQEGLYAPCEGGADVFNNPVRVTHEGLNAPSEGGADVLTPPVRVTQEGLYVPQEGTNAPSDGDPRWNFDKMFGR